MRFQSKLAALLMDTAHSSVNHQDGRLWAVALGLSILLNTAFLALLGFASIRSTILRDRPLKQAEAPSERTITILQDAPATMLDSPSSPPTEASGPKFSRTSEDQVLAKPERPEFIGERDTQVTSSRVPFRDAPPLPSQSGIKPRNPDHIETVESTYQDGKIGAAASSPPSPPMSEQAPPPLPQSEQSLAGDSPNPLGNDALKSAAAPETALLQGPNPVDVPIPKSTTDPAEIKATPPTLPKAGESRTTSTKNSPKPPLIRTDTTAPEFRGNQKKTAIVGSISRTGRSALNVADTPLGRYQAIISRAVEQEWQRNCIRHRDLITPGFLTVRFFVESSGRVKTVQFVGNMETGVAQKGFTLNAIRDAEIPGMPASIKKEYESEPLEIIFNFYF
jgi:hypothetical protein